MCGLVIISHLISFFPDQLPAEVSPYLKELEIRHLVTMSSGHDVDPTALVRQEGNENADWIAFTIVPQAAGLGITKQ